MQKMCGPFYSQLLAVVITSSGHETRGSTKVTMQHCMETRGIITAGDLGFVTSEDMAFIFDKVSDPWVRGELSEVYAALALVAKQTKSELHFREAMGRLSPSEPPTAPATESGSAADATGPAPTTTAPEPDSRPVTGKGSKPIAKRAAPVVTFSSASAPASASASAVSPGSLKSVKGGTGGTSYKEVTMGVGADGSSKRRPTGDPFPSLKSLPERDDDDGADDSSDVTSPRSDSSFGDSLISSILPSKKTPSNVPVPNGSALHAASIISMRDWQGEENLDAATVFESSGYGEGHPHIFVSGQVFFLKVRSASSGKTAKQVLTFIGGPDGAAPTPVVGVGSVHAFHPFPYSFQGVLAVYSAMERAIRPDPGNPSFTPSECLRLLEVLKAFNADHLSRMRQIAGPLDPWSGHPHPTCFHTFFNCMLAYWAAVTHCIGVLGQPDELRQHLRTLFNMMAAQGGFTKDVDQVDLRKFQAMLKLAGIMCGACRRPGVTEQVCPTCGVNVFGAKQVDRKTTEADAKTNADRKAGITKWQNDSAHKERLALSSRDAYRQWTKAPEGVAFAAAHRTGASSTRSTATSATKSARLTEEEALAVLLKNFNRLPKPFSLMPISRI